MPVKKENKSGIKKRKRNSKSSSTVRKQKSGRTRLVFILSRAALFLIIFLITGLFILSSIFLYQEYRHKQLDQRSGIADIVFRQIEFDRFVTISNRVSPDSGPMLTRWSIYYVNGTADIQFDIRNLEFERSRGNLIVRYKAADFGENVKIKGQGLPFIVDVNIKDKDFREIKHFQPQAIKEETADSIATTVGGISAAAGTAAGAFAGWAGSAPAGFIPVLSLPVRGGITAAGGLLGGIGGGLAGYALMKNYLIELTLIDDIGQSSKEEVFSSARKLVASEIFLDEALSRQLIDAWKEYMLSFLSEYGFRKDQIIFPDYNFYQGDGGS